MCGLSALVGPLCETKNYKSVLWAPGRELARVQTTADLCAATMQAVEEFWVAFAPRERCLARVGSSQTPARTVRAPPALLHQQSHLITRERPWRHRGSGDCGRRTIDRSQTRRWRAPLRCHLPSAAAGSSWVIGMGWGRGVDPTVEALNMAVARHPRWRRSTGR